MAKSSFIERNKAVREAWIKEQNLVQEGKGTRAWTPEQQKDILEKGKAYDDSGKAIEGQHMKSAEQYPEYQGDPGNIQFLTRAEHLEAHNGNWQNPTNWYFNPVTKEKIEFGDGPFIPCETIQLPEPIIKIQIKSDDEKEVVQPAKDIQKQQIESVEPAPSHPTAQPKHSNVGHPTKLRFSQRIKAKIKSLGKNIIEFSIKHPDVIKGVFVFAAVATEAFTESKRNSPTTSKNNHSTRSNDYGIENSTPDISTDASSSLDKGNSETTKDSYTPNDVPAGKQRYHYKDGSVKWKDKSSYHRGGNNNA